MNRIRNLPVVLFAAALLGGGFITLAGCAPTETRSGTGEYIDDTVITAKVKAAIMNDPELKVTEINVETFRGVVQLSGFVSTNAQIQHAVTVAQNVSGVTSVKNDMRLK
jgi:osmotically-inducible protein OsmY